ncbi:MAG: hypothetical protein ACFFCV_15885 [Promethearchaeota archaeon]
MLKFRINNLLDLRFEDGKTNIYVKNQLFNHCKYILLNNDLFRDTNLADINSIDDAVETLSDSLEYLGENPYNINPKTIFWAHCSNLQTWYENNYNTNLIHRNLAFPLLKSLSIAGDLKAKRVFKEEIAKRFETNNLNVIQYLLYNNYLDCLNSTELEVVLEHLISNVTSTIIRKLEKLLKNLFANYREIKDLIDILLFIDLNYNQYLVKHILEQINLKKDFHFTKLLLLHLNYKEFNDYKIPYGKFLNYFEDILNWIYEKYPEVDSFIKIIDSGFISGVFSLDEKRAYGYVSYP